MSASFRVRKSEKMSLFATIRAAQVSAGQHSSIPNGNAAALSRDPLISSSFLKKKAHEMKSRVTGFKDSRIVELGARNVVGVSDEESLGPAILAVPLREMILALYKHNRDRQIYNGIGHVIFMVCLLYVILNNYNVQNAAETNLGLADTFLDNPIGPGQHKMSWNTGSVNDVTSYFTWMTNIAIPAVFPSVIGGQSELNSNLRVVGGARLRQVRVRKNSCLAEMINAGPRFANKDGTCYGVYSTANEMKEPYGRNNRFIWTTGYSSLSGVYGWQPGGSSRNYGFGGYVEYLNSSHTSSSAVAFVKKLLEDEWIDSGTRILAFDFNIYNTAKQSLTSCSFMFEVYPSGYGNENYRIYTFDFAGDSDMKRLLLYVESIVVIIVFFKVINTILKIVSVMRTWIIKGSAGPISTLLTSLAFWFDIFEIMVYVVVGGLWISYYADDELADFSSYDPHYTDIIAVARLHVNMVSFGGMAVAVSVLKLFRYLSLDSRMSIVWQTLYIASGEIISITITVFILIIGYAFLGNMLFGADVRSFHSIESSISTLFQMALGSFDYQPLTRARPDVTGIFFGAYICSVYLIAFNIIVGALTTYYTVVHESLKIEGQWKKSAVTFESQFLARLVILSEYPIYWLLAFRVLIANEIFVQVFVPLVKIFKPNYNPDDIESEKLILSHTLQSSSFSLKSIKITVNPLAPPVTSASTSTPLTAPSTSTSSVKSTLAASSSAAAITAKILSESIILQHIESWAADDRFERAVLQVYYSGKKERGFDLYEYLDDFTSRVAAWDSLYISLHELCSLTSSSPCKVGTHFPSTCVARRLMDAYAASKRCTLIGGISGAKKHTPSRVYTSSDAVRFASFKVSKLNRFGRLQVRNLIIDSEQYAIVDLDLNGRVCKKLPLVQLCMIERPMANPRCLVLCFSSSGDHVRRLGQGGRGEEELFELLETTWTIICDSNEEREELHAELMRLFALLPYALSGLGGADSKLAASSNESPKSPVLLGRSRASTKPSTVANVLNKANISLVKSSQTVRSSSEPRTSTGGLSQSSDMSGAELADLTLSRMHKRVRTPSFTSRVLGSAREDFQGAVQITAAISKELSEKRKTTTVESPALIPSPTPSLNVPSSTLSSILPNRSNLNTSSSLDTAASTHSSLPLSSSSTAPSPSTSSVSDTSNTFSAKPPRKLSMGLLNAKGGAKSVSLGDKSKL